jgi:multiple sugar transport system permease protein
VTAAPLADVPDTAVVKTPLRSHRRRVPSAVTTAARYALLVGVSLVFLVPLLFVVVGAFKPGHRVLAEADTWRVLWPSEATLDNFRGAVRRAEFFTLLRNSLLVSTAVVGLGLVVNSLFGYALARLPFRGRNALLLFVIGLIIVPFQAVAIPLLFVVAELGWRNTFHVQVLPFIASPLFIYLFYSFFLAVPRELEEAARMDGAGAVRVFWNVAVPLARPAYGTVAILSFLNIWNELLWPAITTSDVAVRPLPLGLSIFRGTFPIDQGVVMAFVLLMCVPTLVLFIFLQRYFVQSIASSGVKG